VVQLTSDKGDVKVLGAAAVDPSMPKYSEYKLFLSQTM
jgi:hypothetical protein